MAPTPTSGDIGGCTDGFSGLEGSWAECAEHAGIVLESWSQGCMVGALMIMSFTTVANMRRGVLLHKLILLEV